MIFETYQPEPRPERGSNTGGEEIGTILEGEIVLTINASLITGLREQSYAINTGIPHSFSNTSAGICPHYQCPHPHHVLITTSVLA